MILGRHVSMPRDASSKDQLNQARPARGICNVPPTPLESLYRGVRDFVSDVLFAQMVLGIMRGAPPAAASLYLRMANMVSDQAIEDYGDFTEHYNLPGNPDPAYISGQFTF